MLENIYMYSYSSNFSKACIALAHMDFILVLKLGNVVGSGLKTWGIVSSRNSTGGCM